METATDRGGGGRGRKRSGGGQMNRDIVRLVKRKQSRGGRLKDNSVFMFTWETAENKQFNIKRQNDRENWRRACLIPPRHLKVLHDNNYHLPDLKARIEESEMERENNSLLKAIWATSKQISYFCPGLEIVEWSLLSWKTQKIYTKFIWVCVCV